MSDQIDCIYIVHNHDHITSEGSTIYTATSSVLRPSIGGKTFNTGGKKDGRKLMNCVTFTEQHSHIYMLSRSKPSSVRLHCIPYCTGWEWNTVQPTFCTGPGVKSLICIPEWLKSGDRTWNLMFLSEYNPTAGLMFQADEYKHDFSATELMRAVMDPVLQISLMWCFTSARVQNDPAATWLSSETAARYAKKSTKAAFWHGAPEWNATVKTSAVRNAWEANRTGRYRLDPPTSSSLLGGLGTRFLLFSFLFFCQTKLTLGVKNAG